MSEADIMLSRNASERDYTQYTYVGDDELPVRWMIV
jgi:hypothetical protein